MTRPRPHPMPERRDVRAVSVPGLLLVLIGAVLELVSFRLLDWYSAPPRADSASEITFSALHDSADQLSGAGAATAYFDWLSWLLLIALVAIGVAANLPIPRADLLRVIAFLLGLVGLAATYFAIAQLHNAQVSAGAEKHNLFYNSTWGLWLAFLGFAAGAVGAVIGYRSKT